MRSITLLPTCALTQARPDTTHLNLMSLEGMKTGWGVQCQFTLNVNSVTRTIQSTYGMIKMKKGDTVVSTGDMWVGKGSVGVVKDFKNSSSVLVTWYTLKGCSHSPGVTMYHRAPNLIAGDVTNPNTAFIVRNANEKKRKREVS